MGASKTIMGLNLLDNVLEYEQKQRQKKRDRAEEKEKEKENRHALQDKREKDTARLKRSLFSRSIKGRSVQNLLRAPDIAYEKEKAKLNRRSLRQNRLQDSRDKVGLARNLIKNNPF